MKSRLTTTAMTEAAGTEIIQSADGTLWRAEYRPCPMCRSQERKRIGARGGRAHRYGKGAETQVVRCLDCDLIYTRPTLIPQTNPYASESTDEYFHQHDSQWRTADGEVLAEFAEKVLGRKGEALELGCGRGDLLAGAAKRGWAVSGIEMTPEYARIAEARGIKVDCCPVEESDLLNRAGAYDLVIIAAILEHLYDPVETLKRVSRALRPGGLAFIDVPNELSLTMRVGNLYMRACGKDWAVNLSPTFSPFHVVGFSPASLKRALDSTGFRIHQIEVPKWNNVLPRGKGIKQKIERLALGAIQSVGATIGMGDGITCWAIRR
jgi:2-polyprenyl-3-methyl-5-hydroxy-6-metoxy-1,4-benzoquinol methylase